LYRIPRLIFLYKEYVTLLAAILCSIILIFTNESPQVENLRALTLDAVGKVNQQFHYIFLIFDAIDENRELRKRTMQLALENTNLREARLENQRLRNLLGFKESQVSTLLPAEVIGRGFYQFTNSLLINLGEGDGILKDMPVITDQGLVGKIFTVGKRTALVHVITDLNFRVSAKVRRNRALGILTWTSGQYCKLENVAKSFDVMPGDTIITSGYSAIYPPDIPIGVVAEVSDDNPGMMKEISLSLFQDFSIIEEVFIWISKERQEFSLKPLQE